MFYLVIFFIVLYLFLNRQKKLPKHILIFFLLMSAYLYLYYIIPPYIPSIPSARRNGGFEPLTILLFVAILFPNFILTITGKTLFPNLNDKTAISALKAVAWMGFFLLWVYLIILKFYALPYVTSSYNPIYIFNSNLFVL